MGENQCDLSNAIFKASCDETMRDRRVKKDGRGLEGTGYMLN